MCKDFYDCWALSFRALRRVQANTNVLAVSHSGKASRLSQQLVDSFLGRPATTTKPPKRGRGSGEGGRAGKRRSGKLLPPSEAAEPGRGQEDSQQTTV